MSDHRPLAGIVITFFFSLIGCATPRETEYLKLRTADEILAMRTLSGELFARGTQAQLEAKRLEPIDLRAAKEKQTESRLWFMAAKLESDHRALDQQVKSTREEADHLEKQAEQLEVALRLHSIMQRRERAASLARTEAQKAFELAEEDQR